MQTLTTSQGLRQPARAARPARRSLRVQAVAAPVEKVRIAPGEMHDIAWEAGGASRRPHIWGEALHVADQRP